MIRLYASFSLDMNRFNVYKFTGSPNKMPALHRPRRIDFQSNGIFHSTNNKKKQPTHAQYN